MFSTMGFGLVLPPFLFVAQNFGASETLAASYIARMLLA